MKRTVLLSLMIFLSVSFSRTIYGEYTYTYGDDETMTEAKQKCETFAKRDAVQKFATYLRSETVVRNYQTESDDIIANAEAMMTDIKIVEENIDKNNSTIYYKISAEVDETKILRVYEEREKIKMEKIEAERKAQAERMEAERKAEAERLEAERLLQEKRLEAERQTELNRLKHDLEKARIEQETEKYKLSRELHEKDRRFWKTQKWIAFGAFLGSAGMGTYFNMQGSSNYDDYKTATTSSDAASYFDKADNSYLYRDITFSVSLVPLGYFFYSWYQESKY